MQYCTIKQIHMQLKPLLFKDQLYSYGLSYTSSKSLLKCQCTTLYIAPTLASLRCSFMALPETKKVYLSTYGLLPLEYKIHKEEIHLFTSVSPVFRTTAHSEHSINIC